MKHFNWGTIITCLLMPLMSLNAEEESATPPSQADQPITPGSTITLRFPSLSETATGDPAQCEIRIPESYTPSKPVPLLVWYTGWHGSSKITGPTTTIAPAHFLIVALPYPKSDPLPRIAARNNTHDRIWIYQSVMLKRIKELFPNIDPQTRIVAGASSGGHLIATGLSVKWEGFVDYFTGFAIHEGGMVPGIDQGAQGLYSGAKGKKVFVSRGGATQKDQTDFMKYVVTLFTHAGATLHSEVIPNANHPITDAGRLAIRKWIEKNFPAHIDSGDH